jgi:uncharacterized repeat protein (TIGR04076 family)
MFNPCGEGGSMASGRAVRARIVDVREKCPNGHRLGEEYLFKNKTVAGICMGAFSSMLPYLTALRYGASFPWEEQEGAITLGCPDHENCVVWRLERVDD